MKFHFCIGIQARSTSTRLPNKITQMIGNKMIIDHVMDACRNSASYINRYKFSHGGSCEVFVLIPEGDKIRSSLNTENIIEGSEKDVLSRYVTLAKQENATHVVRITADCPRMRDALISKSIHCVMKNGYDYFSNVDSIGADSLRTSIDGHDVEIVSREALDWLDKVASSDYHREHVTVLLRDGNFPVHFRQGFLIEDEDRSDLKLSVDTEDDLARVRDSFERADRKFRAAIRKYGKNAVHRF